MSDIVWAINPSRDSLRDLARRMREHAEEVFTLREIELRFLAPEAPESLRLTMDVRRDLLLIFKEAVSNVARHSQCTRVDIQLSWSASQVVLRIADTGRGFDPYADHDGQGLASMRSRAKRRGGSLSIESSVAGTVLSVAMPLL
jgi:signal transduction histidine kinase